mgnify:CR=1 FL=1
MEAAIAFLTVVAFLWCLPWALRLTFGMCCIVWSWFIDDRKGDPYA